MKNPSVSDSFVRLEREGQWELPIHRGGLSVMTIGAFFKLEYDSIKNQWMFIPMLERHSRIFTNRVNRVLRHGNSLCLL